MIGLEPRACEIYLINTNSVTATLIGGDSYGIMTEIENDSVGRVFGSDTRDDNTNLHSINSATGALIGTTTMSFPLGGDVITAMEFVGSTLYAGFTTEFGGPSSLTTIDTTTSIVSLVGPTGMGPPATC